MRIYYTASARGKNQYGAAFQKTFDYIKDLGYRHLDTLLFEMNVDKFYDGDEGDQTDLYKSTLDKIKKADIVVLDVSKQSLSMGFIIDRALDDGKPVIALHHEGTFPYFVSGIKNDRLQVIEYTLNNLKQSLEFALESAKDQMDVRFNFFVSPNIVAYLDWIAKKKRMPRAVYLRRLIEQDMLSNKRFLEDV